MKQFARLYFNELRSKTLNTFKFYWLLLGFMFLSYSGYTQTHEYVFNNNLNEFNGGPALDESLACGATTGSYGTQTTGTTSGDCLTSSNFCFNNGGGLQYPNASLITDSYTINVFFRFNTLGGYARVIDFSNSAADAGIYFLDNCLNLYPNGDVGACPYFNTNIYYLITFVRDGSTGIISVYVDGTLFGTYNDSGGLYKPTTGTTPIIFFRDDNTVHSCETQPGCVKYISVSPVVSTASDVSLMWNNVTTLTHATHAPLPVVNAGTYGPLCIDAAKVQLSGTPAGGTFSGTGVTGSKFGPGQGTQTVTYTYTDANGCTNSANVIITVNDLPIIDAGADQTICDGDLVTLSGSGGVSYTWSNGVIDNVPFTAVSGQYIVKGTDANGCSNKDTVMVNVTPMPIASIIADTLTGHPVLDVNFINNSSIADSYYWSFGNGDTHSSLTKDTTSESYKNEGTYTVVLTATNGNCNDYDTVKVIVLPFTFPVINIPNIFTPNDDGLNDSFFLETQYVGSVNYVVVNRWGNLMFETSDTIKEWDGLAKNGLKATDGVYFINYHVLGLNGEELKGQGFVTLIR